MSVRSAVSASTGRPELGERQSTALPSAREAQETGQCARYGANSVNSARLERISYSASAVAATLITQEKGRLGARGTIARTVAQRSVIHVLTVGSSYPANKRVIALPHAPVGIGLQQLFVYQSQQLKHASDVAVSLCRPQKRALRRFARGVLGRYGKQPIHIRQDRSELGAESCDGTR